MGKLSIEEFRRRDYPLKCSACRRMMRMNPGTSGKYVRRAPKGYASLCIGCLARKEDPAILALMVGTEKPLSYETARDIERVVRIGQLENLVMWMMPIVDEYLQKRLRVAEHRLSETEEGSSEQKSCQERVDRLRELLDKGWAVASGIEEG